MGCWVGSERSMQEEMELRVRCTFVLIPRSTTGQASVLKDQGEESFVEFILSSLQDDKGLRSLLGIYNNRA